jgi:hypothetical protein
MREQGNFLEDWEEPAIYELPGWDLCGRQQPTSLSVLAASRRTPAGWRPGPECV